MLQAFCELAYRPKMAARVKKFPEIVQSVFVNWVVHSFCIGHWLLAAKLSDRLVCWFCSEPSGNEDGLFFCTIRLYSLCQYFLFCSSIKELNTLLLHF